MPIAAPDPAAARFFHGRCAAVGGWIVRFFLTFFIGLQIAVADEGFERLPAPQPGTYETILAAKSGTVQVFAYPARQPVFVIDFPTLAQQGRMFNRIVALVERMGVGRARVLDDQELAQFIRALGKTELTFAFGNDFLVHEMVVFFNLAEYGGIALNPEERALRAFLLEQGLIRERFGFLQAMQPNGVILSIPQEKSGGGEPVVSALARQTILMHELSHAEYYTNPHYRDWCRKFWHETLSKRQRNALRTFLAKSGYDPDNEELMINEAQAYLLHTPDPRAFNARMAGLAEAELEGIRQTFLKGYPDALLAKR